VYAGPRGDRGSTVGEEVAASLGRIDSLMTASNGPAVSYGVAVPSLAVDPVTALRKLRMLRTAAAEWPRAPLDSSVRVEHASRSLEDFEIGWSTLATELAFVVSATIEAQRSIVSLLSRLGLGAPEGFGSMPLPAL